MEMCNWLCPIHLQPCVRRCGHDGDCLCEAIADCLTLRELEQCFWKETEEDHGRL